MTGGLQAVMKATAAVFVRGRRAGSAVLVDDRHLLTAEHVLRRQEGGRTELADEVELVFPAVAAGDGGGEPRVSARRIPLETVDVPVDAAVLDLGDQRPGWLPKPVDLWPAERLPARLSVLGFPRAENALRGVWRDFATSGPAAGGAVQLDWEEGVGTLPGHSGGPVVDQATGALVGVLVEGSEQGRFDRFLPLVTVQRRWPGLPRPWLIAGQERRSHFSQRARGQRSRMRGGDLFRGRGAALAAVRQWLTTPRSPGQPLVVTGQPGAGKSAVIARVALDLERSGVGPGLAFHCRSATLAGFITAIAELTGVADVDSDTLLDALQEISRDRPWPIVVDALDEAANEHDRRQIAATLSDLATLPTFRIAVTTRPLAVGDRYLLGELLPTLGVTSPRAVNLVDLDTDRFFEPTGLEEFVAALLVQQDAVNPGPPDTAWTAYRTDVGLRRRLARVIADRADRNYLVAAMAAVPLSTDTTIIDPTADDFDPGDIPAGVGEALDNYFEFLPPSKVAQTRGLLTALAYARGAGIDDRTWVLLAAALGYAATIMDLDELRDSAAADYLLQTAVVDTAPATRLFHQALIDQLLLSRKDRSTADQRAVFDALTAGVREGGGWKTASPYSRRHAAEHAAAAGHLSRLVEDADFLAVADFTRLLPLVWTSQDLPATPTAVILRQVGARAAVLAPTRRTRLLALAAAHLGLRRTGEQIAAGLDELLPRWAHSLGEPHHELTGHAGGVCSLVLGRIGKRTTLVSGGSDGTMRIWDAQDGTQLGPPLVGHTGGVYAVATGRVAERELVVSGGSDATVRIWDALDGTTLGSPLIGHSGPVRAVAVDRIGGDPVVISGGDDGTVRIWHLRDGEPMGPPLAGHTGPVMTVALHRVDDRTEVIICCTGRGVSHLWDPVRAEPLTAPFAGHPGGVYAAAVGHVGGRAVVVSAGSDGTTRVWDPLRGEPLGSPIHRHRGPVRAVALGRLQRRDVIVSAGNDGAVQIWDLGQAGPLGDALTGHIGPVRAVALAEAGPQEMVVSGGNDGTVRIWDTPGARPASRRLAGHTGTVNGIVVGRIEDQEVVVSGSDDGTVRIWDSPTGRPHCAPLTSPAGDVKAVAVGRVGDRDVVVAGCRDGSVRTWDLIGGQPRRSPLSGHAGGVRAVAVGRIADQDVIVSGGGDGLLQVWDPVGGRPRGASTAHVGGVRAVAVGRIGTEDVVVSGGNDGLVRIWNAASLEPLAAPLTSHSGRVYWVRAVALGRIAGSTVVIAGVDDGTVRLWSTVDWQPVSLPLTGHTRPVSAVAAARIWDRDLIVSGSLDNTVRIWDEDGMTVAVLDLLGAVGAVALSAAGTLCAATGPAVCTFGASP